MSSKFKETDIKHSNIQLFDNIIIIQNLDPNKIKVDEKSYKKMFIYYIGYVTIKSRLKTNNVNPLYLITDKINGHIEEKK